MSDALAQDFVRFSMEAGVLRFGEFRTKAGRLSPYFFNAGLFNDGALLGQVAEFYAQTLLAAEREGRGKLKIFSGAAPLSSSNPLTMLFGTTTATVEFAGLISNGLNQFNIVVPRVAAGDYLVTPKIGSIVGDPAKLTVGN